MTIFSKTDWGWALHLWWSSTPPIPEDPFCPLYKAPYSKKHTKVASVVLAKNETFYLKSELLKKQKQAITSYRKRFNQFLEKKLSAAID